MNTHRIPPSNASSSASTKPSGALKVRSHVRAGISVVFDPIETHASGDPWSVTHPADH